jgi:CBS domain-containing protein
MEDVFVGSLMSAPVYTVRGDATLRAAAQLSIDHDVGAVVVVDEADRLVGIVTVTDFVRVVADEDGHDSETTVATAMSTDVVTMGAEEPIERAADRMVESGHYHLPVVDGETLIGIITAADLTAYVSTVQSPSPPGRD